jgi:hypothetical protein
MYRNPKLTRIVAQLPCQHCGIQNETVVAAHSNQLRDGKGRSIKADDFRVAALCYKCHAELDQGSKMTKQERVEMWEEAHRKTIGKLFEEGWLEVNEFPF